MLLELGVHVGKEDPVYLLSISVGSAALDTLMGCDLAAVMPRVIAVSVFVLFPLPLCLYLSLPFVLPLPLSLPLNFARLSLASPSSVDDCSV